MTIVTSRATRTTRLLFKENVEDGIHHRVSTSHCLKKVAEVDYKKTFIFRQETSCRPTNFDNLTTRNLQSWRWSLNCAKKSSTLNQARRVNKDVDFDYTFGVLPNYTRKQSRSSFLKTQPVRTDHSSTERFEMQRLVSLHSHAWRIPCLMPTQKHLS